MILNKKQNIFLTTGAIVVSSYGANAFVAPSSGIRTSNVAVASDSCLNMGLFDPWTAGGSKNNELDEAWEEQQELLRLRRAPTGEREKYFNKVNRYE